MGKYETVDCGKNIDEGDFHREIKNRPDLDELSKKLLRGAASYISTHKGSIWANAEVAVLGPDIQLLFVAGNQANQFVVTIGEDNEIKKYCKERGWRMLAGDVWEVLREKLVDNILDYIVQLLGKGAKAVGSSAKKAIGYN